MRIKEELLPITWPPDHPIDWCFQKMKKKYLRSCVSEENFLSHMLVGPLTSYNKDMLQFGQKSLESKDFYRIKRITDTLDHDKIVVSKSIPFNKEKDQCYIIGSEDGDKIVPPLHLDTSKGN